jgi:hypothetical protein
MNVKLFSSNNQNETIELTRSNYMVIEPPGRMRLCSRGVKFGDTGNQKCVALLAHIRIFVSF